MKRGAQLFLVVRPVAIAGVAAAAFLLGCKRSANQPETVIPGYQPPAQTDARSAELQRQGDNLFTVSVKDLRASVPVQKNPAWCWAACAQAVLEHAGYQDRKTRKTYDQEELIRALAEHRRSQAATAEESLLALVPESWEQYNRAAKSLQQKYDRTPKGLDYYWNEEKPTPPLLDAVVEEISAGNPALVGLAVGGSSAGRNDVGHVVLAIEVEYAKAVATGGTSRVIGSRPPRRFFIKSIKVIDPVDGKPATISGAALEDVRFAGGRATAGQFIKDTIAGMNRARWEKVK